VIAMTAQAMDGDRKRCLDAGMDDYITKPLRHADLVEMLQQWIPADPPASPPPDRDLPPTRVSDRRGAAAQAGPPAVAGRR